MVVEWQTSRLSNRSIQWLQVWRGSPKGASVRRSGCNRVDATVTQERLLQVLDVVSTLAGLDNVDDLVQLSLNRLPGILPLDPSALSLIVHRLIQPDQDAPSAQQIEQALCTGATTHTHAFTPHERELLHHVCVAMGAALARIGQARAGNALREQVAKLEQRCAPRALAPDRAWAVSLEPLCIIDANGYVELANPAWQTVLGWTEAQVCSQPFTAFVHRDDLAATQAAWIKASERGQAVVRFENRYRTSGGVWRWLSWVAVPEDGKVYCAARDVTDEKLQREALILRTRERDVLAAVFQATDLLLQVIDADYRFLAINQASVDDYWRLFQRRVAVGDRLTDVLADRPEQLQAALALWDRALGGEAFSLQQTSGQAPPEQRTSEMRFEILRDHDGKQIGAFMTSLDVTEWHMQQQALVETQEALRQSQKLEAIGQLTGGVAHDFNNVLAVIKSSIELLRRVQLGDERRQRFMDSISSAVTRGARLTGQLLAFARRQALQPAVFDVGNSTRAIGEMIGSLTGVGVEVVLDLPDEACFVNADQSQFDTTLVNLAVNARDAMQSRGTLRVKVESVDGLPQHGLQPAISGTFVAVSLHDTGAGIAPENLEKIFEPFFTTKGVGHGTGLGLSQVFGFARQSGGDVRVASTPGAGTTFTLYLPCAAQPVAGGSTPSVQHTLPGGGGLRILAVEDNPELRVMVESSLHELGYATTIVTSAEQALALLRDDPEPYAAVFSDVVLPGMTGIDLGRALARLQIDIPVVLTSGYSHVLAQESDHGFLLLPKPYALDDLARLLHEAVLRRDRAASVAKVSTTHAMTLVETVFGQPARAPDEGVERVRLAELAALHIMDTEEEAAYDELTHLASAFCQTPIALVSLVDDERQWFKARVGLQARETPREHAFCAYAIEQPEQIMQVVDATLDARFVGNPLVTGDPGIRFYAGAPLVTSTGQALGTLCVIDTEPRKLTVHQLDALRLLAARVIERLEARRVALNLGAPRDSEP